MSDFIACRISTDLVFTSVLTLLKAYAERVSQGLPASFYDALSNLKKIFVSVNDQEGAKAVWCLETIGKIQDQFVEAFRNFQEHKFYTGWCLLERCEIEAIMLQRHFEDKNQEFGMKHIIKHVELFQSLFPYKIFMSPGFLEEEVRCSICDTHLTPRNDCSHIVGEIYNGEYCARRVVKCRLLEISFTPYPVQRSAVPFSSNSQLNYGMVKYVVDGLRSPWHSWKYEKQRHFREHRVVSRIGRNHLCPCESGLKYKKCGLIGRKEEVVHIQVKFEHPPPSTLPSYVLDAFFTSDIDHPISKKLQ